MRLPLITVLLTTAALATACERPAAPAETPATEAAPAKTDATAAPAFALDPEGLRIVNAETGASRLIAFGTPAAEVQQAMAAARPGQASEDGRNDECPAGAIDYRQWPDLTLSFQGGQFVGWDVDAAGPTTLTGIGIGSTQAQLEAAHTLEWFADSTLGQEFTAGNMSGLVEDGAVSHLWAGVTCIFR